MRYASTVEAVAQILVHVAAVAEYQRAHHLGAAWKKHVDALSHGIAQRMQPRLQSNGFACDLRVREIGRGIGGHPIAPQVGGKVKLPGIGGGVRRPQMAGRFHALSRGNGTQRRHVAAQIETDIIVKRLSLRAHIRQTAGEPHKFRIHNGRIRHRAGKGDGKTVLNLRLHGNGLRHARRAQEQAAGSQQRGTAPPAHTQGNPCKEQRNRAGEQNAQRQPAVLRRNRAQAKEGRKQHQRPRVQRPHGQKAPALHRYTR